MKGQSSGDSILVKTDDMDYWKVCRLMWTRILSTKCYSTCKSNSAKEISFSDHRIAYAHLNRSEVLRAWIVLKLCSFDFLIQNSIKVSNSIQYGHTINISTF